MSWEPHQEGQAPQQPTPPPDPYGAPSSPTPPSHPYGPPVNPYGPPPAMDPYGQGQPPVSPYMPPTYYGGQPGPYPPLIATPLPLGQALRELPRQYWRVLTRPSPETFAQELGKASWDIIWVQLLGLTGLYAIISFFVGLIASASNVRLLSLYNIRAVAISPGISLLDSLIYFILYIGSFFILQGLIHLLAKAFNGQGSFLHQCYSSMLIYGPLLLSFCVSTIMVIIPPAGIILELIIVLIALIYAIVLLVFATMGSQRLPGGQASAAVLIPTGGLLLLLCCVSTVFDIYIYQLMLNTY